jgi:hypothetical protein
MLCRAVLLRKDTFDDREMDFYEALYTQSQAQFGAYVESGTVLNNYAHIFDLLIRLRQVSFTTVSTAITSLLPCPEHLVLASEPKMFDNPSLCFQYKPWWIPGGDAWGPCLHCKPRLQQEGIQGGSSGYAGCGSPLPGGPLHKRGQRSRSAARLGCHVCRQQRSSWR